MDSPRQRERPPIPGEKGITLGAFPSLVQTARLGAPTVPAVWTCRGCGVSMDTGEQVSPTGWPSPLVPQRSAEGSNPRRPGCCVQAKGCVALTEGWLSDTNPSSCRLLRVSWSWSLRMASLPHRPVLYVSPTCVPGSPYSASLYLPCFLWLQEQALRVGGSTGAGRP